MGPTPFRKLQMKSLDVARLRPLTLGALTAVAFLELLDPASGVDEALFSGEERMALGTNADAQVLAGAACLKRRAAGANDGGLLIFWMNFRSHAADRLEFPRFKGREE